MQHIFCWSGIAPTLRDSQLEQIEAEIRLRYRQRSQANVTAAREALLPFEKSVRELKGMSIRISHLVQAFSLIVCFLLSAALKPNNSWWTEAIQHLMQIDRDDDLVRSVKNALHGRNSAEGFNSLVHR